MLDTLQQIHAVLSAPIPFFIALFAVLAFALVAMWRAFEWRYRAVIDRTNELYKIATSEAQLATQVATRGEIELKDTLAKLTERIKGFEKQKDKLPADVRPKIDDLTSTLLTANSQLSELGKANTAVSEALERQARLVFPGEGRFAIDETRISVLPRKRPKSALASPPKPAPEEAP